MPRNNQTKPVFTKPNQFPTKSGTLNDLIYLSVKKAGHENFLT